MSSRFTCGALFAGIGGFCLGFKAAGLPTRWAVEHDEHAAATYELNFTDVQLLQKSVAELNVAADQLEPVDVLHAGFPCQSFSQAGDRKGFDDPRGRLFFQIIRLIEEFKDRRPAVLVLENAPFLRYGEGGAWFLELQKSIQKAGYWFRSENCQELSAFGLTSLPQQRTRLFMVAFSMSHFRSGRFEFPNKRHGGPKNLRDYIDFDGHVDGEYYLPRENRYFDMISRAVTDRSCVYQLRKYQVRPKEPGVCPTLTANMGLGGHNVPFIMNSKGLRKLTEDECLRLQDFHPNSPSLSTSACEALSASRECRPCQSPSYWPAKSGPRSRGRRNTMVESIGFEFPPDGSGQWDGFNEAGMEHFSGNPFEHLVGRRPKYRRREGEHAGTNRSQSGFCGDRFDSRYCGLKVAFESCLKKSGDESDKAEAFFQNALKLLEKGPRKCSADRGLQYTGVAGPCENGTPFFAMMKATGQSKKSGIATGSYGIGKFAPFTVSDLRTVFLSTVWQDASGAKHHYVQGKSILMSHLDNLWEDETGNRFLGSTRELYAG